MVRGRVAEALCWVEQAVKDAETYHDSDLLLVAHFAAMGAYFWLGDPIKSREHADQLLALYSEERHGGLAEILNHDPKTMTLLFSALSAWLLGYPEQAVSINSAADAQARRLGHPFQLSWVLTTGATVFDLLGEPDDWLRRIEEANRLGRENSLPVVTDCLVPIFSGIALIRKGPSRRRHGFVHEGHGLLGGERRSTKHFT
jgi:hypothetical protein